MASTYKSIFKRFIRNQDNVFISPVNKQSLDSDIFASAPSERGVNGYKIDVWRNGHISESGRHLLDPTMLAGIILHEGIHSRHHMARAEGNEDSYPTLYRHLQVESPDQIYESDHESMAEGNISTLIEGMREFDKEFGTTHSDEWYASIAWVGLKRTSSWENLSPELKSRYDEIYLNEMKYLYYLHYNDLYLSGSQNEYKDAMENAKAEINWNLFNSTRTSSE